MKFMKWLTNIYDPRRKDAKDLMVAQAGETWREAWQDQQEWLQHKIIGEPQATPYYAVDELKAMGMVGIYGFYEPSLN